MPRLPMNYQNTIIYKIVCRDLAIKNCYVGQTTNFINRKAMHKQSCKTKSQYVYQFIREHGGWNNWDMVMIEQYNCYNLVEAGARERHWIETLNADLNKNLPPTGLSKNEYDKQHYTNNRDKIVENQKQYRTNNRDKYLEQAKQYYIENRDRIAERANQRVCCLQCKKEFCYHYLATHCKTQH